MTVARSSLDDGRQTENNEQNLRTNPFPSFRRRSESPKHSSSNTENEQSKNQTTNKYSVLNSPTNQHFPVSWMSKCWFDGEINVESYLDDSFFPVEVADFVVIYLGDSDLRRNDGNSLGKYYSPMKKYTFIIFFFLPILGFTQVEEPEEEPIEEEIEEVEITNDTIIPETETYEIEAIESTAIEQKKTKKWAIDGYLKDLRTAIIDTANNVLLFNNQIHNRLNFNYYFNENWTFKADLRTQIFYGNLINTGNPLQAFSEGIDGANDDFFDLSLLITDNPTFTMHTMLDRLYLDYSYEKWNVRVGRQRINWGINTVWNPHDIFNAFSYFDFDYEERPGSDAVRVTYYTGATSSVEFAVKAFENIDEIVAGGLWKFNKWNYDFQVLGGVFNKDIVTGIGWAGNIKNLGFKGETALFQGYDTASTAFAGTVALDYSFANSVYTSLGFLYNSSGTTASASANLLALNIDAKNLFPYKYTGVAVVSYPFNPSFSGSLSIIYSPSEDQLLFINPTLTYTIKDNWNIDLIGQIAGSKYNNGENYGFLSKLVFLRVKWSF